MAPATRRDEGDRRKSGRVRKKPLRFKPTIEKGKRRGLRKRPARVITDDDWQEEEPETYEDFDRELLLAILRAKFRFCKKKNLQIWAPMSDELQEAWLEYLQKRIYEKDIKVLTHLGLPAEVNEKLRMWIGRFHWMQATAGLTSFDPASLLSLWNKARSYYLNSPLAAAKYMEEQQQDECRVPERQIRLHFDEVGGYSAGQFHHPTENIEEEDKEDCFAVIDLVSDAEDEETAETHQHNQPNVEDDMEQQQAPADQGEVDQPETIQGEANQPETIQGEANQPETIHGEVDQPETIQGQVEQPETIQGEAGQSAAEACINLCVRLSRASMKRELDGHEQRVPKQEQETRDCFGEATPSTLPMEDEDFIQRGEADLFSDDDQEADVAARADLHDQDRPATQGPQQSTSGAGINAQVGNGKGSGNNDSESQSSPAGHGLVNPNPEEKLKKILAYTDAFKAVLACQDQNNVADILLAKINELMDTQHH